MGDENSGGIIDLVAPRIALRDVGAEALTDAIEEILVEVLDDYRVLRYDRGLYTQDKTGVGLTYKYEIFLPAEDKDLEKLDRRITRLESEGSQEDGELKRMEEMRDAFLVGEGYETDEGFQEPYVRSVSLIPFSPHGPWGASMTIETRRAHTASYEVGERIAKRLHERFPSLTLVIQEPDFKMNLDGVILKIARLLQGRFPSLGPLIEEAGVHVNLDDVFFYREEKAA